MERITLIENLTPTELRKVWEIFHTRSGSNIERITQACDRAAIDLPEVSRKVVYNLLLHRQRVL